MQWLYGFIRAPGIHTYKLQNWKSEIEVHILVKQKNIQMSNSFEVFHKLFVKSGWFITGFSVFILSHLSFACWMSDSLWSKVIRLNVTPLLIPQFIIIFNLNVNVSDFF